jgi:hypothetical protein
MNSRAFDMAAHEHRLDRLIARSFSASFMSNSKWRRFFASLEQVKPPVPHLTWKFVGRDEAVRGAPPDANCIGEKYVSRTSFALMFQKQAGLCALCGEQLPEKGSELDRTEAFHGYVEANVRLVHHHCHVNDQASKKFA